MTLKVYEANRNGLTRVLRPKAPVVPATTVDESAAYPDCLCKKCRAEGKADLSYRALLDHTMFCPACLAGAPCVTKGALGRAWRRGRA